jgi:hypothetical protein
VIKAVLGLRAAGKGSRSSNKAAIALSGRRRANDADRLIAAKDLHMPTYPDGARARAPWKSPCSCRGTGGRRRGDLHGGHARDRSFSRSAVSAVAGVLYVLLENATAKLVAIIADMMLPK